MPTEIPEIPQLKTIWAGISATLITSFFILALIYILAYLFGFSVYPNIILAIVAAFLISAGFVGARGIVGIPVGHKAVPLVLKKRRIDFFIYKGLFSEGYYWVFPPPLMGAETIDVREKQTPIENFTALDKEGIKITASASIQWKIIDPFKSLSITEGVIEKSLGKLIESCIRTSIRQYTTEDILGAYEETKTQIKTNLSTAAEGNANTWGIEIIDVIVSHLEPPTIIVSAYENRKKETIERESETTEQEHARTQIKESIKELGLSPNEAKELFQTERGKVKKETKENKFNISQETADAITNALGKIFQRKDN